MGIELRILDVIQTIHNPILDNIFVFITKLGDAGFIWVVLALILVIRPKTRKCGIVMIISLLLDVVICNGLLKNIIARTRPCDVNNSIQLLIPKPHDYSFPSGHTSASFAAVSSIFLLGPKKMQKPVLLLAIFISFSRMYLYVHYPTDIIGGIIIGLFIGYLSNSILNKLLLIKENKIQENLRK